MTPSQDSEAEPSSTDGTTGEQGGDVTGQATKKGTVPTRTTGSVSVRDIAKAENMGGTPIRVTDLGKRRGLNRTLALRELITSQEVDQQRLANIRRSKTTWRNWVSDYSSNALPYEPFNADDVRQVVLWSARNGKKIRAVGAGHSHSKAASPDESYLNLYRYGKNAANDLSGKLQTRPHRSNKRKATHYKPPKGKHTNWKDLDIVRVGAGSMLKYLNRKVLKNANLGLLNMGSFDEQTMAGAINTGTHGTGRYLGTLADSVLSVEMVTVMESPAKQDEPIVRRFRIEPTNGITDRSKFEANVENHGTALIQNNDIFHSVVVGYGAMGVATSYTVKVRTNYFLRETTKIKKWNKLKKDLTKRNGFIWKKLKKKNVRHFQFFLNIPATFGNSPTNNPKCMVRWHEMLPWKDKPKKKKNRPKDWPPRRTAATVQDIGRFIREQTTGAGVDPKTKNPGLPFLINQYFRQQRSKPYKPFRASGIFNKRKDTAWYIALRRTADKYHDKPAKPPNDPDPAMTTEVAVPIDQVEEAVETVMEVVQNMHKDENMHYMAPLGVRFVAPSPHYLSAEYNEGGRPDGVAMLELPFSVSPVNKRPTTRAKIASLGLLGIILSPLQLAKILPNRNISQQRMLDLSKEALQPVEQRLIDDHNGRPHMGKHNSLDHKELEKLYPKLSIWETVNEQFNAFGTFDNRFTRKLGLDQHP